MNTDPEQIRAAVGDILADLPSVPPHHDVEAGDASIDVEAIDAVGRRLEQAHKILVDALESVEKG